MKNAIETLNDFIDVAVKNRKYPETTGGALKAAVKLTDEEINEEERGSIEKIKANLGQIYINIQRKHQNRFTASSIMTYKSRVLKVIGDYEKYGLDPSKIANWNPKNITRKRSEQKAIVSSNKATANLESESANTPALPMSANMNRIELAIRPDLAKVVLIVPWDLRQSEKDRLAGILQSLVTTEPANEESKS